MLELACENGLFTKIYFVTTVRIFKVIEHYLQLAQWTLLFSLSCFKDVWWWWSYRPFT